MVVSRDLTHKGDNLIREESDSSSSLENPFGNDSSNEMLIDESPTITKGAPMFPNSGSATPHTLESLNNNDSEESSQLIPPLYHRYPSFTRNSNSGTILSSKGSESSLLRLNNSKRSNMNSILVDADFSPFGGYPLSSFPLSIDEKEPDDYLHNPDPILDLEYDKNQFMYAIKHLDKRSAAGLIGLLLMILGIIAVFIILPVLTYSGVTQHGPKKPNTVHHTNHTSSNSSSHQQTYTILSDYVYPRLTAASVSLIDVDTPDSLKTRTARDGSDWELVFSDEFNVEGRSFYEGDDQFWYGADFYYAATQDLEWYDPDALTTSNGTLHITMDSIEQHDLFYRSGMLHSWNKMCFTQGILEFSVKLPGKGDTLGLWPGLWSMGNLARPGYMASSEGTWPYSYELCDAGITPNQSSPDGISYMPGQKLNACTCEGEDHPNRGVGRGAPEIDVLEGANDAKIGMGVASQSLQIAPMDVWYYPDYAFCELHNRSVSLMNTYTGGPLQQAISATTTLNNTWYESGDGLEHHFQKFSYEYLNDNDDGYIRWFVGDDPTLTLHAYALSPNGNIDWRRISKEPMSIVMNLGISNSWNYIDWPALEFPATFEIDYVRVYQPSDSILVTCDPDDYPTLDYIQSHLNAYENNNLTSWKEAGYTFPKHSLNGC